MSNKKLKPNEIYVVKRHNCFTTGDKSDILFVTKDFNLVEKRISETPLFAKYEIVELKIDKNIKKERKEKIEKLNNK
jgi:hypothetical protein